MFNWFKSNKKIDADDYFFNHDNHAIKDYVATREGSIDTYSDTWAYIKKWSNDRINKLRADNDSILKDEIKTAFIRGKIAALKELSELPSKKKKQMSENISDEIY